MENYIDTSEYYGGFMPELDELDNEEDIETRLEYERSRDEYYADIRHEEFMLGLLDDE